MVSWHSIPALLWIFPALASPARADRLAISVLDEDGDPVEHAVVYARPVGAASSPAASGVHTVIDQIDKEYVPYVTAVQVGTTVNFPNKDQIRHHVYSFSEAKTFEIPLYEGTPAQPVVFDKPGSVALGCNIHDWMKAYVFVTESPYFAVTGSGGGATIELPAGEYAVEVWHPELAGKPSSASQLISMNGAESSLSFAIEKKRVWEPRRAPSRDGAGGYR